MKIKKFTAFLVLFLTFSVTAYGGNVDEYYEDSLEASGAQELYDYLSDDAEEYLEKLGCDEINPEKLLDISLSSVVDLLWSMVKDGADEPIKALMKTAGIVLAVSVCSGFFPDDPKSKAVLNLICGCMTVISVFAPALGSIRAAVSAIGLCAAFEKALIPVLAGVVASSGNPTLALSFKGIAFTAAEFISSLADSFAMPLIGISAALGISGAMLPTLRLTAVSDVIRKTMTTVLAFAASLFTAFLSLKSVIAVSTDSLVIKGVRMASSFVPVVGGALGEAYNSVFASISLLKNAIGIYAIVAFLVTGIPVVINLALWVLTLRISQSVAELLDCSVCSDILRNVAFVFSMTNAILLLCMAVFIISSGLIVSVKSGG